MAVKREIKELVNRIVEEHEKAKVANNHKPNNNNKASVYVKKLQQLGDNQFMPIGRIDNYVINMGIGAKNNRRVAQIRISFGINTILKIRNTRDLEVIQKVISNPIIKEIVVELDKMNERRRPEEGEDLLEF